MKGTPKYYKTHFEKKTKSANKEKEKALYIPLNAKIKTARKTAKKKFKKKKSNKIRDVIEYQ